LELRERQERNLRILDCYAPIATTPYGTGVTDTNRTTEYENQEAQKLRRSFPHPQTHAALNTSHQYSAGKTGRTFNADYDSEITTFNPLEPSGYYMYHQP
jgi:hypothetical protein